MRGLYYRCISLPRFLLLFVALSVCVKRRGLKPPKFLGAHFICSHQAMIPSKTVPTSVDKVRPGDIKAVAAMGDEFLLSPLSGTFKEQGSSFVTGGEGFLRNHATLLNILRFYNANVTAGSYGCNPLNECFNVAQLNATSNDLEQQAISLIKKMKSAGIDLEMDWKLITIFVGTHDLGQNPCKTPHSAKEYKFNFEIALWQLRWQMKRVLISIISMWNLEFLPQLRENMTEKKECTLKNFYSKRRKLCEEYRKAVYEIQDERNFDAKDFTVVVQGFLEGTEGAVIDESGNYDSAFYTKDLKQLTKYGYELIAKAYWTSLLEPVGKKNLAPSITDKRNRLKCPIKVCCGMLSWTPGFISIPVSSSTSHNKHLQRAEIKRQSNDNPFRPCARLLSLAQGMAKNI